MKRLVLTAALVLLDVAMAWACSCTTPGPACQAFWHTDVVFIGEVTAIETTTVPMDVMAKSYQVPQKEVHFRVVRSYRGNVGAEATVHTGLGGGDCGYKFELGHSYLVYASQRDGDIRTGICSRTAEAEKAADDIAWLDSLPSLAKSATALGTVTTQIVKDQAYKRQPMPGVGITVTDTSGQVTRTTTDAGGAYSVTGLAAGEYSVAAILPDGFVSSGSPRKINLHEQGCAQVSFYAAPNGTIRGRVLDAEGQGVKGMPVALNFLEDPYQIRDRKYLTTNRIATTAANGEYEFDTLLPGNYIVIANQFGATKEHPFPRLLYPGVEDPVNASPVSIGFATGAHDIDFRLPPKLTLTSIEVEVKDASGNAVANARVFAHDQELTTSVLSLTGNSNAIGLASLEVFEERAYFITATLNGAKGGQRCGGPVMWKKGMKRVAVTIERLYGNCMASLKDAH
ncbi:MAG: carboxypeptidase regulatory-like domain-containing protein [Acidobacteriia bacterium]|nr:carboxypeptidase regulatory-like domain-containing protein [Terriglobia bacterium]